MRTLILALLLMALNCFGAPLPNLWLNAWSTNRSVLPVFGDNNLSISNRVAGPGGGTNWDFKGIGPSTVARLKDSTNISQFISTIISNALVNFVTNRIGQSNGNYVLKVNGPSTGQTATNLNSVGGLGLFDYDGNYVGGITNTLAGLEEIQLWHFADGGFGVALSDGVGLDGEQTFYPKGSLVDLGTPSGKWRNAYFSGTLDVSGVITDYDFANFLNGINVFGDFDHRGGGGHFWGTLNSFSNATTFYYPSASKLAAFDANKVLTNSVYSDADIASRQGGSMTLSNLIAMGITNIIAGTGVTISTNAGVLTVANSGQTTALTFNPNQFASAGGSVSLTNAPLITNAWLVGGTIATNQNSATDPFRVQNTNTTQPAFLVRSNGNVGIGTNGPNASFVTLGSNWFYGHLAFPTDNTYDIGGLGGANRRPRTIYAGTGFDSASGGTIVGDSVVYHGSAGDMFFGSSGLNNNSYLRGIQAGLVDGVGTTLLATNSRVGIGTTAPAAKLDVVGTSMFSGLLTATQSISSLRSNLLAPTAITFPNSTVNWTNPLNCNIELYIDNTAVTGTAIKKNGTQIFGGLSNDVTMQLQPGEYFSETYSVGTPSATFSPF